MTVKKKIIYIALLLFGLGLVTRLPLVFFPPFTIGDESLFLAFIKNTLGGIPFFEPHTPFFWFFHSTILSNISIKDYLGIPFVNATGVGFGTFPFTEARFFSVFFGSLVPVLIFLIGLKLGLKIKEAFLPGAIALFDNSLITVSGVIMPDSMIIFFGLLGLFTIFFINQQRDRTVYLLSFLAGIFFSVSFSAKWLGLSFLAIGLLIVLNNFENWVKRIKISLIILFSFSIFYFLIFVSYLNLFVAGPADSRFSLYKNNYTSELVFPGQGQIFYNVKFFFKYNKAIFGAHSDSPEIKVLNRGQSPLTWITGSSMTYFDSAKKGWSFGQIRIFTNPISWRFGFLCILILSALFLKKFFVGESKEKASVDYKAWSIIIFAFFVNFVPFFLIEKFTVTPVWLFHYFPALCFSLISIPFALKSLNIGRKIVNLLYFLILISSTYFFVSNFVFTYPFYFF